MLLPAGERTRRFYPRYDTARSALDEALSILRQGLDDLVGDRVAAASTSAPEIRVGVLDIPIETIEVIDLAAAGFNTWKPHVLFVEQERYGAAAQYPADVPRVGGRPLLQYPVETLEATMASSSAIGVALGDRVSGRVIAYALGNARGSRRGGVQSDPHFR